MNGRRLRIDEGFTLVELLVVIAIIGFFRLQTRTPQKPDLTVSQA